jgi:hypothetical protein
LRMSRDATKMRQVQIANSSAIAKIDKFSEGLAAVCMNGKIGYINKNG